MINKSLEKDIVQTIESVDGFHALDFTISSSGKVRINNALTNLKIKMPGTTYSFSAKIPHRYSQEEVEIDTSYSPGDLIASEACRVTGKAEFLERIEKWLWAIKKDMDSTYTHRKIEEQRERLEKLTEKMELKEDYFSSHEAKKMRQELDRQHEKLRKEIRKQSKASEELEQQLQALKNDFEELEKRLVTQTKGGWIRSWTGRAFKWSVQPENQQTIIDTTKTVKALLTDGDTE